MNANDLRSRQDIEIARQLMETNDVRRINEMIEKREQQGPMGTRRRLLATSVRLSQSMAPWLHEMADDCITRLGVTIPLELYVYASPSFNAACVKPEDGRLFIMFSSSLLESFEETELRFVLGHELGHYLYQHHDVPIGYLLRGNAGTSPRLALQLTTWSRYAEISADRAGAHCAADPLGVARALFKLASGLSGKLVQFNIDEFMRQVDEMQIEDATPGQGAAPEDWFLTHPFSPLRVRALKLFDHSILATKDGTSVDELEAGVQVLMTMMEPSYLEGRTDTAESMRRLLFAGAICVANANGEISDHEIAVFEKFFGDRSFNDTLNLEKITRDLPERITQTKTVTTNAQRMQVIRDLCTVARADKKESATELEVISHIARELEVPEHFVGQAMSLDTELD
jgi:tellurite resistance protein